MSIYKQDISKIITTFQAMYYRAKQAELSAEIADIEKYLNSVNKNLLEDLCKQSMVVLKDKLARKYEGNSSRKTFSEDNLWKEPYDVLAEYPVILSTTFSSRNSLNSDVVYDYLIMDEASQVDIATGALALSSPKMFSPTPNPTPILITGIKSLSSVSIAFPTTLSTLISLRNSSTVILIFSDIFFTSFIIVSFVVFI